MPKRTATSFDNSDEHVLVEFGVDDQARRQFHRCETISELADHGLGAGAVEPQDASAHRCVGGRAEFGGDVDGQTEPDEDAVRSSTLPPVMPSITCSPMSGVCHAWAMSCHT